MGGLVSRAPVGEHDDGREIRFLAGLGQQGLGLVGAYPGLSEDETRLRLADGGQGGGQGIGDTGRDPGFLEEGEELGHRLGRGDKKERLFRHRRPC